jgi:hypothetical protein
MSNAGDGIPSHDEQAGWLSFEQWRTAFLAGAESHRLLLHAEAIDVTDTFRMLCKEGTAPSVQGVLGGTRPISANLSGVAWSDLTTSHKPVSG